MVKSLPLSKSRQVLFSDEMNTEADNRKNRISKHLTTAEKYNQDCIIKNTKQGNYYSKPEILNSNLIESIKKLRQNQPFIFQQENEPCHIAKKVVEWFAEKKIECLKWSANSPDLNCIENLLSWLDRELAKVRPRSPDELKSHLV
ncbi:unnamed protein product [Brachionus calyciflorus]|uniref:Tc1-like transposase DDE domain-containing protein n=1 Tax=Brachionus calyciflorus TaxID=104777 RepID=A0A813SC94_9BILA|nr:unnamed protein product [Brachionus calyciflorus]